MTIDASTAEQRDRGASPSPALVSVVLFCARHWLFAANSFLLIYATLPVVAPILGAVGFDTIATTIFRAYSIVCDQLPSHSYFLFGHQMAFCERCTGIYWTMLFSGLAYVRLRRQRLPPLPWHWYFLAILPMAIDGFTQLFGWRESTWLLRGLTGSLFGAATVWVAFPHLQASFDELVSEL